MKKAFGSTLLGQYLFVRRCGGCGKILSFEEWEQALCEECAIRYRFAKLGSCQSCFRSAHACRCMPAGLSSTGMLCLRKLILYRSEKRAEPQNQLIYRLKQGPNHRLAGFVAEELSVGIWEELCTLGRDEDLSSVCLVGVPRSRRAKAIYGHDQAPFLAKTLAKQMGATYVCAIGRRFGGKEQKKQSGKNRFRNLLDRFYATDDAALVKDRCVILLDDVVTTGASMAACTKLLRRCGAREVIGVCIGQNENRGRK